MRRTVLSILMLGLFLAAALAGAQYNSGWRADAGLDAAASITQPYAAPEAAAVYSPGNFGIGGGIKSYVGLLYADIMAAPYVRSEIGAFYLNLGGVLEAKTPRPRSGKVALSISDLSVPVSPYLAMGIDPTIVETAGARWKLDFALEGFFSGFYVDESEDLGDALGLIAVLPFGLALNFPNVSLGVTYSYGL